MKNLYYALVTAGLLMGCATAPQNPKVETPVKNIIDSKHIPINNGSVGVEVQIDPEQIKNIEGHPITSVTVTQCSLIVAVYLTMPDGKLLRFDKTSNIPFDKLLEAALAADRSERVEVDCNGNNGPVGYETHDKNII